MVSFFSSLLAGISCHTSNHTTGDIMNLRERYKYDRTVQRMLDILDIYGLSHLLYNYRMNKTIKLKVNLKNLIIAKGYTLTSFAKKAGISRQHLHRICDGEHPDIKGSTMLIIAELLNMNPLDIWERTTD